MQKIISTLAILFVLTIGCHQEHPEKHHEIPKLEVTNPMIKDTIISKKYVCKVHASRHIELRAMERGYLENIYVDEGATVKKGQQMFKIMPRLYDAELQIKKAEADASEIEYSNTKMLADKNIVSANELALAKANLDKANAEVKLAQAHLDFTNVNAPFSGLMDRLHAREGSLLEEGELLTTLSDNSKMWIYFNVPEAEYLDYVSNKEKQRNKKVELQMANGEIFGEMGTIEVLEGEFNLETGNIEFRATFPNPNRILRHGETGSILMNTILHNAMLIPQKAVFEILDKHYVFIVNDKNQLEQRQIVVSQELPHLFVIEKGLSSNDKILIEGLRKVRAGEVIEPELKMPKRVLAELDLYAE